eukprot:207680-Rhodomonas_salina.1
MVSSASSSASVKSRRRTLRSRSRHYLSRYPALGFYTAVLPPPRSPRPHTAAPGLHGRVCSRTRRDAVWGLYFRTSASRGAARGTQRQASSVC